MSRLLLAAAATITLVLFAMANSHHVELSYIVGEPIRIRLIFLVACAYAAGMATSYFYQLVAQLGRRRRRAAIERHGGVE
jgi:uncharacterized integral membrane protein